MRFLLKLSTSLLNQHLCKDSFSDVQLRRFVLQSCMCQTRKEVSKHVTDSNQFNFTQKAKEGTKTIYYATIVIVGLGVTAFMGYTIFGELLSSFSPQKVYTVAVERCLQHSRVVDMVGDSITSYGEESRRGRRQHISHTGYELNGLKGLRIKFHIKGQRRSGTVHCDARQTSSGWEFRYLFVQLDSYPHETIIVEDNRQSEDS